MIFQDKVLFPKHSISEWQIGAILKIAFDSPTFITVGICLV